MNLWSWRWTAARGWRWALERAVTAETAQAWQDAYAKGEPGTVFALSAAKPRTRPAVASNPTCGAEL